MTIIDLTFEPGRAPGGFFKTQRKDICLKSPGVEYTGVIYEFTMSSMAGTYLDLPGHIVETGDGRDAANYPLEKLYRRRAVVIRLDRQDGSGGVTAAELAEAGQAEIRPGDALIINALGNRQFHEISERSVFFEQDAVEWMIAKQVELLVSDIYESTALTGVFYRLFEAGISTVCFPVNLNKLTVPEIKLTVMPLPVREVTQIPCRVVAEI
ncbi:MAG: cyclase family protein [Victivallaceae bacterium]|jgi:kynurenine formamidase